MANGKQIDNKKMVLESLESIEPCDDQIIDLLLLLLDDWEIRAAVMKCIKSRKVPAAQVITHVAKTD